MVKVNLTQESTYWRRGICALLGNTVADDLADKMTFHKSEIIDYYDSRKISCGLVLDIDDKKLKILNDIGKEAKISSNRVLTVAQVPDFPFIAAREVQVKRLKEISARREELKNKVNLRDLWEIVVVETDEISLTDLSELFFGNETDPNCAASMLRAIFEDRLYFRIKGEGIEVPSADQVQQALLMREKEREKVNFLGQAAEFLNYVQNTSDPDPKQAPSGFLQMLEQAAFLKKEWNTLKSVREAFTKAGLSGADPFQMLVKLGHWSKDENITLRAENVPVEFSPDSEVLARESARRELPATAQSLLDEHLIAIDSAFTRDVDDALSIRFEDGDAVIGVHITDVAHFIEHDSPLDKEIRQRATSLYFPETMIPMIPAVLSEEAASLAAEELRPAISVIVRFGPDLTMKSRQITESVIRVNERLTYEQADQRIHSPGSREARLYDIALKIRKNRIAAGAIIFKDPEFSVKVHDDGTIEVTSRDRETPSQILVSEMMILANNLFARFLKENGIPGIFRIQPPPLEKIQLGDEYDPVASYRSKKALSRGDLSIQPGSHSTLGLDAYTTGTSPLRRYPDLLIQRQLKGTLSEGRRLSKSEVEKILGEIGYRLERASLLERERHRYFLLRHLEQRRQEHFPAIVLYRFPRFYLVQLTQFGLNAAMNIAGSASVNVGDRIMVRIEKINPRDEKLNLSFTKFL